MTDVSHSLLMLVLTSEVALLTAAALVLVGLHARRWWYARRTERLLARGRALVTAVADGQTVPDADTAWLASLSARVQTKLCVTFARSLDGAGRRRLHAARLLSLIGGGSTAVPRLLKDRHPEVRAQAAEWAGQHPDPAVIEDLLELLSDPWGLCRFSAQDSLERLGRAVEGPLVDHLAGKRATEAALQVAAGIPGPRLRTPALALVCDPRDGMRAQAATVLAAIGDGADVPYSPHCWTTRSPECVPRRRKGSAGWATGPRHPR